MKTHVAILLLGALTTVAAPMANGLQMYTYHEGSVQSGGDIHAPCPQDFDVGFFKPLSESQLLPGWKSSERGLSQGLLPALDPPTRLDDYGNTVYWYDVFAAVSMDWDYCVEDVSQCEKLHLYWNPPDDVPGVPLPVDPAVLCSQVLG